VFLAICVSSLRSQIPSSDSKKSFFWVVLAIMMNFLDVWVALSFSVLFYYVPLPWNFQIVYGRTVLAAALIGSVARPLSLIICSWRSNCALVTL